MTGDKRAKFGHATAGVPDVQLFECFDVLKNIVEMSTLPASTWAEFMLCFAAGEAHDSGVTRAEFEAGVAHITDEEWSTLDTRGRELARRGVASA